MMSHLEMCIEEVEKRRPLSSLDDIYEQYKAVIIDRALAGLNALGDKSISIQLEQTKNLTCSDYAEFAIHSAYWLIKIEQGVFPNVLASEQDVERKQGKAKTSENKANQAVKQLKKALIAMDAAINSFPMGRDGNDEYAQMYSRWRAIADQLQQDIKKQTELIERLREYKKLFSTRQSELVLMVNKCFQGMVERVEGKFVIARGRDSNNLPTPIVRFMVAICDSAFTENALCSGQQRLYDIMRGKNGDIRTKDLLECPTR